MNTILISWIYIYACELTSKILDDRGTMESSLLYNIISRQTTATHCMIVLYRTVVNPRHMRDRYSSCPVCVCLLLC